MVMYCFNCGNELRTIDKFCPKCGKAVELKNSLDEEIKSENVENNLNVKKINDQKKENNPIKNFLYKGVIFSAGICV